MFDVGRNSTDRWVSIVDSGLVVARRKKVCLEGPLEMLFRRRGRDSLNFHIDTQPFLLLGFHLVFTKFSSVNLDQHRAIKDPSLKR